VVRGGARCQVEGGLKTVPAAEMTGEVASLHPHLPDYSNSLRHLRYAPLHLLLLWLKRWRLMILTADARGVSAVEALPSPCSWLWFPSLPDPLGCAHSENEQRVSAKFVGLRVCVRSGMFVHTVSFAHNRFCTLETESSQQFDQPQSCAFLAAASCGDGRSCLDAAQTPSLSRTACGTRRSKTCA
jgi:hypothetical protein